MRVTRFGAALLTASALGGAAWAQGAPFEFESEIEAVTVIAAFHDTKPGTDSEDVLYEITLDNRFEKVLENGLQIGGRLTLRGQRDHPSRPGFLGNFGGAPGPAGAFSGLSGDPQRPDTGARGQLETAYLELDGGYGELRVGRDRGAAARFFEGAPSVLTHAAIANPYIDPDGIKIIRTNHDLTGPSAKITYATPRILGLRAAASFTPEPEAAGLDRNVRPEDTGVELSNAAEIALNLSRTLRQSGVRIETALAWSTAQVDTPATGVRDNVSTVSAGANFEFDTFEFGGSWLSSDNGFQSGDYTAWEIGAATKIGETELSLNYGEADDDLARLAGDGLSLAARRDIADGLELAVAYQDETLAASGNDLGGRGVVVEITLSGNFFRMNGN
ncbi:porin [Henriciella sp.]|uniref:porin n=1 Tax=Henriciella sp. TaxID=1968823 RepID=UPI002632CD7E|nr:porin [Henriciella sp.]